VKIEYLEIPVIVVYSSSGNREDGGSFQRDGVDRRVVLEYLRRHTSQGTDRTRRK